MTPLDLKATFDFTNSCNCCNSRSDNAKAYYLNHTMQLEPWSARKAKRGTNQATIQERLTHLIKSMLVCEANDVDLGFSIVAAKIDLGSVTGPLTPDMLARISVAVSEANFALTGAR